MAYFQRYILSIICAAMICGILLGITKNAFFHKMMKMLCGIFMSVTFLVPLHQIDFPAVSIPNVSIMEDARAYASIGAAYTSGESAQVIKEQCEAYILSKAASLEIPVEIEIEISDADPPIPIEARLSGTSDPLQRNTLSIILENDLGVTKEHQIWMEQN